MERCEFLLTPQHRDKMLIRVSQAYAAAYIRLSLLGVQAINELEDCTGVLPMPISWPPFPGKKGGE